MSMAKWLACPLSKQVEKASKRAFEQERRRRKKGFTYVKVDGFSGLQGERVPNRRPIRRSESPYTTQGQG